MICDLLALSYVTHKIKSVFRSLLQRCCCFLYLWTNPLFPKLIDFLCYCLILMFEVVAYPPPLCNSGVGGKMFFCLLKATSCISAMNRYCTLHWSSHSDKQHKHATASWSFTSSCILSYYGQLSHYLPSLSPSPRSITLLPFSIVHHLIPSWRTASRSVINALRALTSWWVIVLLGWQRVFIRCNYIVRLAQRSLGW